MEYSHGMKTFYKGSLWGKETVIVLSNIGKAAAASATVDLINEGVTCLVLIGTAGALDKRLNIGDVVVAENVVEYDIDVRPFAKLYHFPEEVNVEINADLNEKARSAVDSFLNSCDSQSSKVVLGTVATGDHFLVTQNEVRDLNEYAPEALCVDMESSAVASVASKFEVPLTIIRTISNYIDSPDADMNLHVAQDYEHFLQNVQAVYSEKILQQFFARLDEFASSKHIAFERSSSVGILCATENELRSLLTLFDKEPVIAIRGGKNFYQGKVRGVGVVVTASGYGKAAVAAASEVLIMEENIEILIAAGKAFSASDSVFEGDVVLSSSLIEFDVDVRPFRPVYQLPTLGIIALPAEAKLISVLEHSESIHIGQIASGDRVMDEKSLQMLKENLPDVLCVDFDSAPAAQIAYQATIPFMSVAQISAGMLHDDFFESGFLGTLLRVIERCEVLIE